MVSGPEAISVSTETGIGAGQTPADLAREKGHAAILELLEAVASVDACGERSGQAKLYKAL